MALCGSVRERERTGRSPGIHGEGFQGRRAWYVAVALLGLRRANVGGFGGVIPQQTGGGGFYG